MIMIQNEGTGKKKSFKRFIQSFKYPISGLRYAYKNEQNLTFHLLMTLCVVIAGFVFKVTLIEWAILVLTIGLVIASELINTAFEAAVDLVTQEYHPLAKVCKDTAAAAVLVFSIAAVIVGLIIFIPHIIEFIKVL